MVKTVAAEIGTVEAEPYKDVPLKLPSGLVSMQESTPFAVQKMDVREPTGTEEGDAHIETCGAMYGPVGCTTVCAGVVVTAGATGFAVTAGVTIDKTPTCKECAEQRLSNSREGIPPTIKGACHGRTRQIRVIKS